MNFIYILGVIFLTVQDVSSQDVGLKCDASNDCPFKTDCVKKGATSICICRMAHMDKTMTFKTGFTKCTSGYSPWSTYPIEDGKNVDEIDFEYERVPDNAFSATGEFDGFKPSYARANTNEGGRGAWCAPIGAGEHKLTIDLGNVSLVSMFVTQGRANSKLAFLVSTFTVETSIDGTTFTQVEDGGGSPRIFKNEGTDNDKEIFHFFTPTINIRFLRFLPKTFLNLRCFRFNVFGLPTVNECLNDWNQCDKKAPAVCTDTISSYFCTCPPGHDDVKKNGFLCEEVNECTTQNLVFKNNCSKFSTCHDSQFAFSCNCFKGYRGDGYYCENINECVEGLNNCHKTAAFCNNTAGSFTCQCKPGFAGDGIKCIDINECKVGHGCHELAKCKNNIGSYTCTCRDGYIGDGRMCKDINECDVPLVESPCHVFASCINLIGSYSCECKKGFTGNGWWCDDDNECKNNPLICKGSERCYNYPGGYTCMCPKFMPLQYSYSKNITERRILDSIMRNFLKEIQNDYRFPLDFHANNIRTLYSLVMRTYDYRFSEVTKSFLLDVVVGNRYAIELYDFRCSDVGNASFPNLCHPGYFKTQFYGFTDIVDMYLNKKPQEPFENWATPAPLVAPDPGAPTTTAPPILTNPPRTTKTIMVNGTQVVLTEPPLTTPKPYRNCGGHFNISNLMRTFSSPFYPNKYPPNTKCVWTIQVPPRHNVYLTFTKNKVQMEHDRKCFYDYVEVRDDSEQGKVIAKYCGNDYATPVRSGRERLTVIFYSDLYYQFEGFQATWNILEPRVSLTCFTYNQMSSLPAAKWEQWKDDLNKEDTSQLVPVAKLLACKQYPQCNISRPEPIIFTFEHYIDDRNEKICIHWDFDTIGTSFSYHVCVKQKTNKTHTECRCSNWGVVGVLGRISKEVHRKRSIDFKFGKNSYFSVVLVILCLLFTLFYLFIKDQWGAVLKEIFTMKEYDSGRVIQMHIVFSTLLTEILFAVITFEVRGSKFTCYIITFLFYHVLQTVFAWLFIYTLFLKSRVQEVFDTSKYNSYKIYLFVGYCVPTVVTLSVLGLDFKEDVDQKLCWLLFHGTTVWGFSGVIVSYGVITLVLLCKTIYDARDMEHGIILQEKCLRTIFTAFFVLMTSVFGALTMQEQNYSSQYLFSLCNLLQGFSIAVMYCILRREDPIIKANQVGPLPVFGEDSVNLMDGDSNFGDMEGDDDSSDENNNEDDEYKSGSDVNGDEDEELKDLGEQGASLISLNVPDIDRDNEDENQTEVDNPEESDEFNSDDDQEIMFRLEENDEYDIYR